MRITLFFSGRDIPFDFADGAFDGVTGAVGNANKFRRNVCDVAVFEEDETAGISEDCSDIAGGESFVVTDGEQEGALESSGDDFVGAIGAESDDCVGTADEFKSFPNGADESIFRGIKFGNEVCDDFGIGFGGEFVPASEQIVSQIDVILDDAVVNDGEFTVFVGVSIGFAGSSVRSPSRMSDAGVSAHGFNGEPGDEGLEFSVSSSEVDIAFVADGDSGGIIASVSEPAESGLNNLNAFPATCITNNSAHTWDPWL